MKLYGAFSKVEEQDDGTIIVEGIASTESVDSDGEVVKASAIAAALPDYMRDGTGALREMHQPLAAGTAIASVDGEVTTIKGHVVDPVAVKKVKTGVYKGFSIGGKVTARDEVEKNTITGLRLVEISLVDRPANPDARLTMWKAEDRDPDDQNDPGDENPEPKAKNAAETTDLAKGLWNVSELANILGWLNSLQQCAEWESMAEGDGSPIPADLKAAVNTLADILVRMVGEEVAEMKTGDDAETVAAMDDDVAMADTPADLGKADAGEDMLAKMQAMLDDALAKAVAPLNETITKQAKEIAALKAMPAAPKGAIRAPIAKADDVGQPAIEKVDPVLNPDGSVNEVATELKKMHRAGGVISA